MRGRALVLRLRYRPVAAAVVAALLAAHTANWIEAYVRSELSLCCDLNQARLITAPVLVAASSLIAIPLRALWLATGTAHALAKLSSTDQPAALSAAARRLRIGRLRCVEGHDCTAFCAGLVRPRVYITTAAVRVLNSEQLDAVLAHEATHARRHDPLRHLAGRAVADILFYLPLARWWSRRQAERAELHADQVAINHAGRRAVADALFITSGTTAVAATTAFGGTAAAGRARVAQLLDGHVPPNRPSCTYVIISVLGVIGTVLLTTCIDQIGLAALPF